jgi:hypothetical protein
VGHEEHGLSEPALPVEELALHRTARNRIESSEGFVHQEHRRVRRKSSRHADPLALSAGKLARMSLTELRGRKAHELEQLVGPRSHRVLAPAEKPRHRLDVAAHRPVRKKTRFLDYVSELSPQRDRILAPDVAPEDAHVAEVVIEQPIDELQRGRLAAA